MRDLFVLQMPWWELVLRGFLVYAGVFLFMRFSSRREVGEFTPFNLAVLLILSQAPASGFPTSRRKLMHIVLSRNSRSRPGRLVLAGGAAMLVLAGVAAAAGTDTAAGEKLLQTAVPPCTTCHQLKAGMNAPGPSLAGVATRAQQRIVAKDYKGKAKDARAYIRESILDPNVYVVPGQGYAAGGQSLMPKTYAQSMKPEQIDQIVNFLMTLK